MLSVFIAFVRLFKMAEVVEQRICIQFRVKSSVTQSEITEKNNRVYGNEALSKIQIKEQYIRFKDGLISVESDQRSG